MILIIGLFVDCVSLIDLLFRVDFFVYGLIELTSIDCEFLVVRFGDLIAVWGLFGYVDCLCF